MKLENFTSKNHAYAQFLAAVIYNSDDTNKEIKELLLEKYGDIILIDE